MTYDYWCPKCGHENTYRSKDGTDKRICESCKADLTEETVEFVFTPNINSEE